MANYRSNAKENPRVTAARRKRRWATILKFNPMYVETHGDEDTYKEALKSKERSENYDRYSHLKTRR